MTEVTSESETSDLHRLTAREAAAAIAAGRITSEALVRACLGRIAARDDAVHAWAFLDPDLALSQTRARDAERPRGSLHGVPVGIKDVIDTADMPTEYGSPLYAGNRPTQDSATVAQLRAAGAVILGKTRTTEFACPFPTITRNPHDLARTPGVSSAGSAAAVADFMVPLSNGTQTGGSVIRPASLCGVYGYKASLDGLDRMGIRHLKPSIDTLGLFARSLDDLALMRAAHVGSTGASLQLPARAPRIGVCRTHVWPKAELETAAVIETAQRVLATAGAGAADVELPDEIEASMTRFSAITRYEGVRTTDAVVREHLNEINPWSRESYVAGCAVSEAEYEVAKRDAEIGRARLTELFADYDALITPAATGEAPADLTVIEGGAFNSLWTQMHVPCVTIPAFAGPNGMPVGLQIVGPHGADEAILGVAAWVEARICEAAGPLPVRVGG